MTSVPSPTFGPNGFVAPDESVVKAGVTVDIDAAFGGGLNPASSTAQGQMATTETAIIGDKNDQFVKLTQQMDPAHSDGVYQDGIARIYFLDRLPALSTVVPGCQCIGVEGTPIPVGALAIADDGNLYQSLEGGTIDVSGTLLLDFACLATGPIACPATSLNTIYRGIPGWDRIVNTSDGVLGRNVENRQAFETRRAASVAANARSGVTAVRGAVLAVPGVLDAYVTENDTGGPLTVGGVVLPANSLYVAVSGGDPQAIAQAMWSKKAPGCAYAGVSSIVGSVSGTALTVGSVSFGAVAVGQQLFDRTGVVDAGTTIISGSGSSWVISPSQTVASESIFLVDAAYTGEMVQDMNSGYTPPYPEYVVSFREASSLGILFAISIPNTTGVPSNALDLIVAALQSTFSGDDGGVIPQIGSTVFATRFIAAIAQLGPWAMVISLQIGSANTPTAKGTGSITGTVLTISAITTTGFAVGQSIAGPGIADGTVISSLGSGTGGTGTYNLNQTQTVGSGTVTGSKANQNTVAVQINQEPTFNANNVTLTLV